MLIFNLFRFLSDRFGIRCRRKGAPHRPAARHLPAAVVLLQQRRLLPQPGTPLLWRQNNTTQNQ